MTVQAAGPLGKAIESAGTQIKPRVGTQFHADANALIMLHKLAFPDYRPDGSIGMDDDAGRALLRWAADFGLGQQTKLVQEVAARRDLAVTALRAAGQQVARLVAEPEWRLAIGLGNRANAHEIGLSLHGTYGWPVIPGSSLKGLAAAWALASDSDADDMARVLGAPRLGGEGGQRQQATAGRGSVRFLDAVPARARVTVTVDVLTPHVKPYYDSTARDSRKEPEPPAEYHNPVPVSFLAVTGAFAVDLYGPDADDVGQAARWLTEAGDELGAGAKTAAGYGYLRLTPRPGEAQRP